MWTCKQVSNALSREDYEKLPARKKLQLLFHIRWCVVCGKYNRDVVRFHDAARRLRNREEEAAAAADGPRLEQEARARLQDAVQDATGSE